jgi:hypothetical protein
MRYDMEVQWAACRLLRFRGTGNLTSWYLVTVDSGSRPSTGEWVKCQVAVTLVVTMRSPFEHLLTESSARLGAVLSIAGRATNSSV